jgi:hypothetical protein
MMQPNCQETLAHLRRYQALVIEMDPRLCGLLSEGFWEIFGGTV